MKAYKTKVTRQSEIERLWHLFDAKGKILGRLSSEIAQLLIGKNKPYYSSNLDSGDWVVVVNAKEILVSGKKEEQKIYFSHSGFPGGLKQIELSKLRLKQPHRIIEHAVLGMLPKNKLRDQRISRLKIFVDGEYPYKSQKFIVHN